MKFIRIALFIIFYFANTLNAQNIQDITINIADDDAQWPPYTYYHNNNPDKLTGFAIDVIHLILDKNNINFKIELLPWQSALLSVKEANPFHMLLNVPYYKEREKDYFITQEFYSMNYAFFYSKTKFPNGLKHQSLLKIKETYKICGLMGYSYEDIGLTPEEIDSDSIHSYDKLIKILHHDNKRCDVFAEGYEIFAGFKVVGEDYFENENLKYFIIPDIPKQPFHMMISKNFKYGKELQKLINEGLTQLKKSGKINELMEKYNLVY